MGVIPIIIGLVAAGTVVFAGRVTRFERDRSFYPTLLIVIALLYVLFGVQAGGAYVVAAETAVALAFSALAVVAHRRGAAVLLAAGYAVHAVWDLSHGALLPASDAVPPWWPSLCLGFDLAVAAYVFIQWPPRPR